ncbi:InlB B-repeat-containing protein [Lachnospira pectinoschiza]|uniref:Repeat domain (List_Bact_rpt) n=1 Tax=Lachnospira pectinoschiza TaxID=28052 RepID=A0A1G9WGI0_9FIRM|nr:InlB B-repeat-containing protein [Lachnospira pectinoschiza]SDM83672.1 repeat domain (List_Bact_rpt) [Lachnospira pectinoschiza]
MIKSWQSKKDKGRKLLVLVTFVIMLVFLTSSSNVVYALNVRDATFYIDIGQEGASGDYTITWYDSLDNGANQYGGSSAFKAWQYVNYNAGRTSSSVFNFGTQGTNVSHTSVSGNFQSNTPYLYINVTNAPKGKKIKGVYDSSGGYMSTYQPSKTSIFVDCGIYQGDWLNDKNSGRTPTMRGNNDIYTITIVWEDDPDQFANINVNPMIWNGSSWQEFTDGSYGNFKFSGTDNWQNDVCMDALKGSTTYSITDTRSNRSNVYVEKITKIENGVETQIGTTSTGTQTLNSSVEIRIYYKFTYDVVFNSNPTSVTTRNIYGDTITTNPTGSVSTIKNVRAGNSITMPSGSSLQRTGYEFVGWSTNPSYSSLSFSSSLGGLNRVGTNVVAKSSGEAINNGTTITFYAIWKPISYTVHYDMNLANEEQIPDKRVRFDQTIKAPDSVTRDDYEFRSWQVYDGSNYGGFTNNTNTDPSVGIGTKSYINANESFKNLRSSDGTVTLVAVWKHFTDENGNDVEKPNANTSNSSTPFAPLWQNKAIDSPTGYFYYSDTPIVTSLGNANVSGTQMGYYLNTNYATDWQYKRQALFKNGDKVLTSSWYYIESFGYDYVSNTDTENVQTTTTASFTSNKSEDGKNIYGTGYNTINLTDDNQKLVVAWVIMRDTWYDSHISYDETTTYHDTDGYTSLIGDNDIPTLEGIDKLENIVGLDKSNFTDYIVSLIGHDNISGLNLDKSSIVITNYDNSQVVTIGKAENQELDEYNRYTHIDWNSFDVMTVNLEDFADNLFNGDYGVTYHLEDNVSNILENTTNSSVFDLKVEAKTKQGEDTSEAELIRGEYFTLKVSTFGYANAIRIEFPDNWYISEDYPLYIYTESLDKPYDAQKLVEITSDVLYVDRESNLGQLITDSDDGTWVQEFIILTPLYATPGEDTIKVTAYKGDVHVDSFINNNQVYVNGLVKDGEADKTKVKTLNRNVKITVASGKEGSILNRLHEHIVDIY